MNDVQPTGSVTPASSGSTSSTPASITPASSEPTSMTLAGIGDEAAFGLDGQIAAHVEIGWRAIELRSVAGAWPHRLQARAIEAIGRQLRAYGLRACALASPIGNWTSDVTDSLRAQIREFDAVLDAASALGAPIVRVMSFPNRGLSENRWRAAVAQRMRAFAPRAEAAGITIGVENCSGYIAINAERALELIAAVDSPSLRLVFDTGNAIAYGYDSLEYLERVLSFVAHVHVKDAVATPSSMTSPEPTFTLPGQGEAEVKPVLRALVAAGYEGCLSIEPEMAHAIHLERGAPDAERMEVFRASARALELLLLQTFPGSKLESGTVRIPSHLMA